MRKLSIGLVLAMLFATVGIYAASITGSTKTLGGTGEVTVSAPTTSASVSWTLNSSGQVTAADVTWTPAASSNYDIKVIVGSSSGSTSVTNSGTVARTDAVTISPAVGADAVSTANVLINET